ncbi:MAG: hypothetical protein AAGI23_09245 [Bacteroidota bacterium]
MGVWVYPNIVKKENGIVYVVKEVGVPKSQQLLDLVDFATDIDLLKSFHSLTTSKVDFSFFEQANDWDYSLDEVKKNLSFQPVEVLELLEQIETTFKESGHKFIRPFNYKGVEDADGNELKRSQVWAKYLVDDEEILYKGRFDIYKWKPSMILRNDTDSKRIDLSKDSVKLHKIKLDENGIETVGEEIEWKLITVDFLEDMQSEIDHIRDLCHFAKANGYELQITMS